MADCKATNTSGVRYREHETRKHGRQKDRYYYIRYTKDKKRIEEGLGWASRGWSEQRAGALLFEIKENIRLGKAPQSFRELCAINKEENDERVMIESHLAFGSVFEKYMTQAKIDDGKRTYESKLSIFRFWISPVFNKRSLHDIKKQDIENIKEDMLNKDRSPGTVKKVVNLISQVYKYAIDHELFSGNIPTAGVKIPQRDNKRTRYLSKQEARMLLDELAKHSRIIHDMALLSLYTGMRAGEIRKLQWTNVLWESNRINAKWRKNGESDLIPMHPQVLNMLKARYREDGTGFVFKSKNGTMIGAVSMTYQRVVQRLGFNLGIDDVTQKVVFHTLRHTYASWLVMGGVDLYTTQKLMGHKSHQMTQRYAHLAPEHLEKAVNSLENI